jgi:ADP-ribose pyrophosphatase
VKPDESKLVYDGRWLDVTFERWGKREREIVERADVVVVVALDSEGFVTLVRQFREPARAQLLELPAGRIEDGEEPLATAKRELEEETGLRGGRWRAGPVWWSTPGFCRERVHLFVAEELERGEPTPDADEVLEIVRRPVAELEAVVGELEDAKSLAGILLYLHGAAPR